MVEVRFYDEMRDEKEMEMILKESGYIWWKELCESEKKREKRRCEEEKKWDEWNDVYVEKRLLEYKK